MIHQRKRVSYSASNSYETLNELTEQTKNIWFTIHGMGFLSRFFLEPFKQLNTTENYFIAPQAPSKYYLKNDFKYVGASWLTKEDTSYEMENNLNYLDEVLKSESLPKPINSIFFGFSQGVSIVTRYVCKKKVCPNHLILYAGSIPNELTPEDFDHLDYEQTKIKLVCGNKDHFLTPERLVNELEKSDQLFQGKAEFVKFSGGHEILPDILMNLI